MKLHLNLVYSFFQKKKRGTIHPFLLNLYELFYNKHHQRFSITVFYSAFLFRFSIPLFHKKFHCSVSSHIIYFIFAQNKYNEKRHSIWSVFRTWARRFELPTFWSVARQSAFCSFSKYAKRCINARFSRYRLCVSFAFITVFFITLLVKC